MAASPARDAWSCQPKLNHQRTSLLKRASATMLASVIDPDSAMPPYEQLAHMLRDEIGQGLLSGRVPSIHAISQHHHVSHRVAARALSILKGEGLLVSVPGQDHYVRERQD